MRRSKNCLRRSSHGVGARIARTARHVDALLQDPALARCRIACTVRPVCGEPLRARRVCTRCASWRTATRRRRRCGAFWRAAARYRYSRSSVRFSTRVSSSGSTAACTRWSVRRSRTEHSLDRFERLLSLSRPAPAPTLCPRPNLTRIERRVLELLASQPGTAVFARRDTRAHLRRSSRRLRANRRCAHQEPAAKVDRGAGRRRGPRCLRRGLRVRVGDSSHLKRLYVR